MTKMYGLQDVPLITAYDGITQATGEMAKAALLQYIDSGNFVADAANLTPPIDIESATLASFTAVGTPPYVTPALAPATP
jgi:hypothetical protein